MMVTEAITITLVAMIVEERRINNIILLFRF